MSIEVPLKGGPRSGEKVLAYQSEIVLADGVYTLVGVGPCRMPVYYKWTPK